MSSSLTQKTIVLITGANQGIGFQTAKLLATEQPNYHIIMTGRRLDAIEAAISELQKLGLSVSPLVLDLNSDASIAAAASLVKENFGHLDVLINNAAVGRAPKEGLTQRGTIATIFDTNVAGTIAVTEAFIPLLKASKEVRRIVFIGSNIGSCTRKADPDHMVSKVGFLEYATSKAAGNYIAMFYAAQFRDDKRWKINLTCPGLCSTNLTGYNAYGQDPSVGAKNAVRLATLGEDGETATFTSLDGVEPF